MADELKPCPFCGATDPAKRYFSTKCRTCGGACDNDNWSHRPIEDALRAEVAAANERAGRLEEERGQLREAWSIINSEAIDEYAETLTHIVAARAMLNAALVEVPDAM